MRMKALGVGCLLVLLIAPLARLHAADPPRVAVATYTGESGGLLRRTTLTSPWLPVKQGNELYSGDLLVGGPSAKMESLTKDVGLAFRGDLAAQGPFPVLETAIVLHDSKDVDFDFTLDRGRITVTNQKKTGSAKVRIHVRDKAGEITLKEPGASFALEIYGRWPTGVPFKKDAKPEYGPPLSLVLLVLKGEVAVKTPMREAVLKEPPGFGMFITDNIGDPNAEPLFIDKLPPWAKDGAPSEERMKLLAALDKFHKQVLVKPVTEVLNDMINATNPVERNLAVVMMGALDQLQPLAEALTDAKHRDVWDAAVLALRHWIGRGPGQDMIMYNALIEKKGFKPVQAEGILTLLHSFSEDELNVPETYEMLLNYMANDRLGVRGLAHWHLIRLVPEGQKFGYDPLAPKEKREEALKKWHEFIPVGKLPPKLKLDDKTPEAQKP